MKSLIIFNLLAIININLIVNAHQNHDHQIYNWSNSKNKSKKTDDTVNFEKLENKKNNSTINYKSN
tara:strand:- start:306 stop:503 length:198 start_codon:yes stop_codon:yes gene_type:complete